MQYSTYDLHCHSNMSDGELCPQELVKRAKNNGVEVLSLNFRANGTGIRFMF